MGRLVVAPGVLEQHLGSQLAMATTSILDQIYPRAMWPSRYQILGYAAWGGVVVAGGLFLVQPFGFIKDTLGLGDKEKK